MLLIFLLVLNTNLFLFLILLFGVFNILFF